MRREIRLWLLDSQTRVPQQVAHSLSHSLTKSLSYSLVCQISNTLLCAVSPPHRSTEDTPLVSNSPPNLCSSVQNQLLHPFGQPLYLSLLAALTLLTTNSLNHTLHFFTDLSDYTVSRIRAQQCPRSPAHEPQISDVLSARMTQNSIHIYCNVLPGNASVITGFWILYLDLLDKLSGGIYY
jgi:hypothetical protein